MMRIFFTFISFFLIYRTYGYQPVQTARLISTAGAGVASYLVDEATILNPASLTYFNTSSLYVSKGKISYSGENFDDVPEDELFSVIASDASGPLKGSFAYHNYDKAGQKSRRYSFSMSSFVGKKSSLGVTTHFDKEGSVKEKRFTLGFFHAIDRKFSTGFVFFNPTGNKEEQSFIFGTQYLHEDYLILMLDFGGNIDKGLSESAILKGAIQLKVYNDFYIRVGYFENKNEGSHGTGMGIGWVQPRLNVEIASKNSTVTTESGLKMDEKYTVLSIAMKF